jgi:NTP pyrophosphatase (non-canonical NTP hydrolase)
LEKNMSTNFNKLTPAQAERLALLAEECGEVVQAVAKVLRHGYKSCHPMVNNPEFNNRYDLEKELGDVLAAMKLMARAGDIENPRVIGHSEDKLESVQHYLHHAKAKP